MKLFKQYITEADTSSATNEEKAIVYVYNTHQGMSHEQALKEGGMNDRDFLKLSKEMLDIAENIWLFRLKDGNRGKRMKMAEKSGPNHYRGASDNTSKADFYGNNDNHISLKQSDDKKGAQLMSAKAEEGTGTVIAGIEHYQRNSGFTILRDPLFKEALKILEDDMLNTARSDVVVPIGAGKSDLGNWYIASERFGALKKKHGKKYKDKQIKDHMMAELKNIGAVARTGKWQNKLIPEIGKGKSSSSSSSWITSQNLPDKNTMKDIFSAYISSDMELKSGVRTKYTPKDMDTPTVRKQVTELITASIDAVGWKKKLSEFFEKNKGINRWIIYEAASGLFKFTGKISDGKDYTGDNWRVANKILVFRGGKGGGFYKEYANLIKWSEENAGLVKQIDISYKGQKTSRYIKLGIPTKLSEQQDDGSTENIINECIDDELHTLNEEIRHIQSYYLEEGFFSDMGKKLKGASQPVIKMAKSFWDKIKIAIIKFYERVILSFMSKMKVYAEEGVINFLSILGIQISANLQLATPSW